MSGEQRPALTPSEWDLVLTKLTKAPHPESFEAGMDPVERARSHLAWSKHANTRYAQAIAINNAALPDDDPRKLSRADLAALETCGMQDPYVDYDGIARLRAKLNALLPPNE